MRKVSTCTLFYAVYIILCKVQNKCIVLYVVKANKSYEKQQFSDR